MDVRTAVSRRSALRLVSGFGIGGMLFLEKGARTALEADHAADTRAIEIEWLSYTDAGGQELGRIRPYWMNDVTNHDGVVTPDGQRDLAVRLAVRNTGTEDLVISPARFALWDARGFVVRPVDIYAEPATDTSDARDARLRDEARSYLITAALIAPRNEQDGIVTYRVPEEAWFRGLLFMPEPERVLVLADFRRKTSVIVA
jgi:hypothetical protein